MRVSPRVRSAAGLPVLHPLAAVLLACLLPHAPAAADPTSDPVLEPAANPVAAPAPAPAAAPQPPPVEPAEKPAPDLPGATAPAAAPAAGAVVVKGFTFTGNKAIPSSELDAVLTAYIGLACDLPKLNEAANRISTEYHRRGLALARAYLPAQEIENGLVKIDVLEGKLGEVFVEGNKNYSSDFIKGFIRKELTGLDLTTEKLERALLILNNQFKDLKVTAAVERGKEPGTVDIRATVEDRFPLHVGFSYNNFGNEFVGRHRFGIALDWTNAVIPGALLSLAGVTGEDPSSLLFGSARYSFPVDECGTQVAVNGSFGGYQVSQEFAELGLEGELFGAGASVSHPLVRTRKTSVSVEAGFQTKDTDYLLLGETTSEDRIRYVFAAADGDCIHWGGKSMLGMNMAVGLGEFLDGLEENSAMASRLDADNSFFRLTGYFARIQPITDVFSVFGRFAGQWSSDSMVSGEQWQIGGPDSVRGYAPGEFGGDSGINLSIELRASPLENRDILQLAAFMDYGYMFRRSPTVGQGHEESLTGAGVGVRSHLKFDADMRLDLGWPIDPDANSFDEDPILYASAGIRF